MYIRVYFLRLDNNFRLSTIRGADEILVINHGKVIERGQHENLMSLQGVYAELVQKQAKAMNQEQTYMKESSTSIELEGNLQSLPVSQDSVSGKAQAKQDNAADKNNRKEKVVVWM